NSAVHEMAFEGADIRDGIFIDIFPFDLLPASRVARTVQYVRLVSFTLVVMSFSRHAATVSSKGWIRALRRLAFVLRPVLPWRRLIIWREYLANPPSWRRSRTAVSFEMYGILHSERTQIDVD